MRYITLEGIDGSGKSTIFNKLYQFFSSSKNLKDKCLFIKQPKNEELIKLINLYMDNSNPDNRKAVELLFLADQFFTKSEIEKYKNLEFVFFDRNWLSTLAYQTINTGLDFQLNIFPLIKELPYPDILFYLHTNNLETNLQRIKEKTADGVKDPVDINYLKEIEENYKLYMKMYMRKSKNHHPINTEAYSIENTYEIVLHKIQHSFTGLI